MERYITLGEIDFKVEREVERLRSAFTIKDSSKMDNLYTLVNGRYSITTDEFNRYFSGRLGSSDDKVLHKSISSYMKLKHEWVCEEYDIDESDNSLYNAAIAMLIITRAFVDSVEVRGYIWSSLRNCDFGELSRLVGYNINLKTIKLNISNLELEYLYIIYLTLNNRLNTENLDYLISNNLSIFENKLKLSIISNSDKIFNAVNILRNYIAYNDSIEDRQLITINRLVDYVESINKTLIIKANKLLYNILDRCSHRILREEYCGSGVVASHVQLCDVLGIDAHKEYYGVLSSGIDDIFVLVHGADKFGDILELQLVRVVDNHIDKIIISVMLVDSNCENHRLSRFIRLLNDFYMGV